MADIAVQSTHTNIFRHTQIFLWTRHTHNESCSPELCGGSCLAACNPSLHAIFNKMLELGFKQNGHGRCVHDKGLLQQFISGYYPRINTINHFSFKQRFAKISQSGKRTLLGPSSGWKHILAHLKLYLDTMHVLSTRSMKALVGAFSENSLQTFVWSSTKHY